MKKWIRRSNVFPAPIILAGLLIAVTAVLVSGCSLFSHTRRETKRLYKGLEHSKGSLVKIMVILPIENDKEWSGVDLGTPLLKDLKKEIEEECHHVRVLLPDSSGYPAQFKKLERKEDGKIDNYALALSGRASGINMVLSGRLLDIRYVTEHHGIFWWGKTRHLARIQMDFIVFHTGTAAKLFDKTITKDIEIKESEGLRIKEKEMPDTVPLKDTLADIAEIVGETGNAVFEFIPWEGYVTSVDGKRLVLSSGGSIGLKAGKVLDIFSASQVTRGKSGDLFLMEGIKVGKIILTAVYPDHSEAVLEKGGPVSQGSIVRLP